MSGRGQLLDCRAIQERYAVKRTTAEAIMRAVPKVRIDGVRKNYVWSRDVEEELERRTAA